jgi:MoaA/NifB/PqqE/SkfB family radical SAM enzyme
MRSKRELTSPMQVVMGKLVARAAMAKIQGDGRPFVLALFATNRCNLKCRSCLWRHNDWRDVPLEDLKALYRDASQQGFVATAISGGEPFLRKDLGELVRYVKQDCGMPILLFTAGWYLRARMDEVLPHIDMMMVSLDSARAERHDAIRGLPGLFDRAIEGVKTVRQRYPGVSLQFNTCVQRGIEEEIDGLAELARALDVHISFDVITPYRHGAEGSHFTETEMSLSPREAAEVCRRLLALKRAGAPILNSARYFQYFVDEQPGYVCHFPKIAMAVDGRGYVENCLNLDEPIANIRETPLQEIMELPAFKQLRIDAESCSSCNSPTMVDTSIAWQNPALILAEGGIAVA